MLQFFLFLSIFVKADFEVEGLTYHVIDSEALEVQVVKSKLSNSTIIFPPTVKSEGNEYKVVSISSSTFSEANISQIETIYFPFTLKYIESDTFSNFKNLKKIGYIDEEGEKNDDKIPPLITKLNSNVFSNCQSISSVDLNNVIEVCDYCFQNSIRISKVNFRVVEIIGPYSFASIQLLQNIEFPSTLKEIQSYAFVKTALVNITGEVPNLESIDTGFYLCSDLVSIPKLTGIRRFEGKAFSSCSNLKEIHCGSKLEAIFSCAFMGCVKLETFTTESNYYLISGESFSQCHSLKSFNFDGAFDILNNAFEACESLDVIDMSRSKIQFVNWQVFLDCGDLSLVILPPQLTDFNLLAFENCNIHSLTFTGTNTTLDLTDSFSHYDGELYEVIFYPDCDVILDNAFSYCGNLSHVVLPKCAYSLMSTFEYCTNLTEVENLKYCVNMTSAFSNCYKLKQIDSLDSLLNIGQSSFTYCSSLKSIPKLTKIRSIGSKCFQYCFGLEKIECGIYLSIIESYAFYGCYNLQNFIKERGSFSIGNNAFCECFSLKSFDFTTCLEINESAFYGCSSLETADLNKTSIQAVPVLAFADCTSLKKVVLPADLSVVSVSAFSYCTNLTSVEFFTNTLFFSIHSNAFEYCTSLQKVYFKQRPSIIFSEAFFCCTSLESVVLGESYTLFPTWIDDRAFYNCTSLTKFDFSKWSISEIGMYAFSGCPLSKKIKFEGSILYYTNFTIHSYAFSSPKINTIDFRFGFHVLSMSNESFSGCPNLKCVMIASSLKDQLAKIMKKSLINGVHCVNFYTQTVFIVFYVVFAVASLIFLIVIIVKCCIKRKQKKEEELRHPLITQPNQLQYIDFKGKSFNQ